MFGNPETTTGGRALKFYASVRMDIRRIASIKDGDVVVGGRTRVKVVKNKVAPPFREAEFDVMYGEGISRTGDLLDLAVDKRIIEKSGAWFAYGGERLGQGRENAKQFLKDNPDGLQGDRGSRPPRARHDARRRRISDRVDTRPCVTCRTSRVTSVVPALSYLVSGFSSDLAQRVDRTRCPADDRRCAAISAISRCMSLSPLRSLRSPGQRGEVAQLVEHTTENRSVDSSILSLATKFLAK